MADTTAQVSVPDLILYVAVMLFPLVAFWAVVLIQRLSEWALNRFGQQKVTAPGPPIEQLAADLRRVHRVLRDFEDGTPIVRWRATRQAYDTLLVQACTAVQVCHQLDELPVDGFEREMERLRIEEALREAGLAVP
jgi:hypothetical protein